MAVQIESPTLGRGNDWNSFYGTEPLQGNDPFSPSAFGTLLFSQPDAASALDLLGAMPGGSLTFADIGGTIALDQLPPGSLVTVDSIGEDGLYFFNESSGLPSLINPDSTVSFISQRIGFSDLSGTISINQFPPGTVVSVDSINEDAVYFFDNTLSLPKLINSVDLATFVGLNDITFADIGGTIGLSQFPPGSVAALDSIDEDALYFFDNTLFAPKLINAADTLTFLGITGGGGSFLAQDTARFDAVNGNDSTGTIGDLSKPFLTVQAIINAAQLASIGNLVIEMGNNSSSENVTTSLANITFGGVGLVSSTFQSLTYTGSVSFTLTAWNVSCGAVTGNTTGYVSLVLNNAICGDVTNSGGPVALYSDVGNCQIGNVTAAGQLELDGGIVSQSGVASAPGFPIYIVDCHSRVLSGGSTNYTGLITVDSAGSTVYVTNSALAAVTAAATLHLKDSRVQGANNATSTFYEDLLLLPRYQMSIDFDATAGLKLLNDSATPGNGKYYGTDSGGTKGFFALPSGGSGDVVGPSSSADSEVALFNSTTGKLIKRATGSGLAVLTSGVLSTTTNNSSNWDTAFTERRQWDGSSTNLVAATGRTSLGLVIGTNVQAWDADLDTLAGLTATTNNFIVSVGSAWASRTPTQVKSTLAIANTDVSGLGTLSTQNGTFSGTSSGTNTGDQTITLTGDVTGSGTGSFAATIGVGKVTDAKMAALVKPAVAVVADANLTLSGEQTIDGVTTVTSLVLATAQSTASQNGPWVSASGAWTRPTWYSAGSTTQAPQFLTTFIRLGTTYQGSTWRMTTASVTIDTTSTTWVQTPMVLRSSSVSGTLPGAVFPALTGDVTTSAGSLTTVLGNIPTAVTMAGYLATTAIAAPGTPAAGIGRIYIDSTSKNLAVKDDAGVIKHGVQTKASVASNFLTAISDAGVVSAAQPADSDISFTDITTGNATTSQHGFVPKFPGGTTTFLRGDGTFAAPSGGGDALTTNPLSQFAATTSAQLAGVISDETGTGLLVFGTSPIITTPTISTLGSAAGTALNLNATISAAGASSIAGTAANLTGSAAIAGTSNAGAAAGGPVVLTSGNAARLTSGNANGGNITLTPGTGIGTGTSGFVEVRNGVNPQEFDLYNTFTDASNYERFSIFWGSNALNIRNIAAGTGTTTRAMKLLYPDTSALALGINGSTTRIQLGAPVATQAYSSGLINISDGASSTATSGTNVALDITENGAPTATSTMTLIPLRIKPTINYSAGTPGAGNYEALKIAVTETALPTGTNYLIRASAGSGGSTDKFAITNAGLASVYNGIATAGVGNPYLVAAGRVTAQSAANASISTYTTPAVDGSYEVSMNMNVTAATALSTSLNCNYTDESNTARTMIFPVTGLTGSFLAGGLVTATGAFETPVMHIRCKASTAITLYTATGTFTSVTYTAEGNIIQTK